MRHLVPAAALFALIACSPPSEPAAVEQPVAVESAPPTPATTAPAPEPAGTTEQTVGGDGSPIRLAPVSATEVREAELPGELACSFDAGSGPLLVAAGDVASQEAALGIVKVGSYVERVAARGGFDGMLRGAVFTGRGKTIRVVLTGQPTAGGESPPTPATLAYERADGASRTIQGEWICGP